MATRRHRRRDPDRHDLGSKRSGSFELEHRRAEADSPSLTEPFAVWAEHLLAAVAAPPEP